jgi:hypothetical protein
MARVRLEPYSTLGFPGDIEPFPSVLVVMVKEVADDIC